MRVISDEEQANMAPGTAYVMTRVADAVGDPVWPTLAKRRYRVLCEQCREICWFDPMSFGRLPDHVRRICMQCLVKNLEEPVADER